MSIQVMGHFVVQKDAALPAANALLFTPTYPSDFEMLASTLRRA